MCYCRFLFLCLLVFVFCVKMLLCWGHRHSQLLYVFLLDLSLDHCVVSFLISWNILYFRDCFVWYKVLIFICMEYLFHPLTFSLYVSLGLKWVYFRYLFGYCFCMHSASLCLLVGTFNPFTFKVIIDMYVLIAIFLIEVYFFSSCFFSCVSYLYKSF